MENAALNDKIFPNKKRLYAVRVFCQPPHELAVLIAIHAPIPTFQPFAMRRGKIINSEYPIIEGSQ
jgi:hypothetical protein